MRLVFAVEMSPEGNELWAAGLDRFPKGKMESPSLAFVGEGADCESQKALATSGGDLPLYWA